MLLAAITTAAHSVMKSAPAGDDPIRAAAKAALTAGGDPADLESTLRTLIADGYQAGSHAAGQQLGLDADDGIDWATWAPGDPAAAALTSGGGLRELLADTSATISGIHGSVLDQLGNAIGDGLTSGASIDTIAGSLSDIVGSGSRAQMIAHTETARAMTVASLDTYTQNGVTLWDVILSDGACDECVDAQEAGPYGVADTDIVPVHPYCRCSSGPRADSVASADFPSVADDLTPDDESGLAATAGDVADAVTSADTTAAVDLTALSDDDLAAELASDDATHIDNVLAELDRRDQAESDAAAAQAKQAARNAAARAKRAAQNEADAADKAARMDAALAAGMDEADAVAEIYGISHEQQATETAIANLRGAGYKGRGLTELIQAAFQDNATQAYLKAEDETNGFMVNAAGKKAGIDPRSLFVGPESRARKYASDELLQFWQDYGRPTVQDFRASVLGGKKSVQADWA